MAEVAEAKVEEKKTEAKKTPAKKKGGEKKALPEVRSMSRGRVNRYREMLQRMFMQENPDMRIRWVYHNEGKPEKSNVMMRQMDGYQVILGSELGNEYQGPKDEPVRVGDLIFMKIDKAGKEALKAEKQRLAMEQRGRVSREFYEKQRGVSVDDPFGKSHRSEPVGNVKIDLVEKDLGNTTQDEKE